MDESQRLMIINDVVRKKARRELLFFVAGLGVVWGLAAFVGWRLPIALFAPYFAGGAVANWLPWTFGAIGYRSAWWVLPSVWCVVSLVLALAYGGTAFFVVAAVGNGIFAGLVLILAVRERSRRTHA